MLSPDFPTYRADGTCKVKYFIVLHDSDSSELIKLIHDGNGG